MVYPSLLAYPFRVFFVLVGLMGILLVGAWVSVFVAGVPIPSLMVPGNWHAHEMLYGWVAAAIAGFILTAVTNWTSTPPIAGGKLLALVVLWLAGRGLVYSSAALTAKGIPYLVLAFIDISFFPLLAVYMSAVLIKHKNYRNLILVLVLCLLALGNVFMHIGSANNHFEMVNTGKQLGFNVITLVMVVIAGRITPAFSINWLRRNNLPAEGIRAIKGLDIAAIASILVLVALDLSGASARLIAAACILAAALHFARMLFWQGWKVRAEPLLWILHLGYAWIVLALGLRALNLLDTSFPASAWQHALGAGAMATLIFGVMTRVAMGHTGRPIKLQPFAVLIFLFISLAAILRLAVILGGLDFRVGMIATSLFWLAAHLLFLVLYWPIFSQARVDGKPG